MTYEALAIILMLVAVVLILLEFVWLYVISQKQEDYLRKKEHLMNEANNQFKAILSSPTYDSREYEIEKFISNCNKKNDNMLYAVAAYIDFEKHENQLSDERKLILDEIYEKLNPVEKLKSMLKTVNKYEKSYICRCLADLNATEAVEDIRKCIENKNPKLKYNAGMALSILGDQQGVISFLKYCQGNKKYSHRILLELFDLYTGDKAKLVQAFFEESDKIDDYMKATIIKAVKKDKLISLKNIFIEDFSSKNYQIRVACVKAMAEFDDVELQQYMITASKDKDWIIRLSSISGLEKIGTEDCVEALKILTTDEQWWVRKRAAESLVRVDADMDTVEEVIKGYDRYASDAVKECLYKSI